jgi:hypothetical protein
MAFRRATAQKPPPFSPSDHHFEIAALYAVRTADDFRHGEISQLRERFNGNSKQGAILELPDFIAPNFLASTFLLRFPYNRQSDAGDNSTNATNPVSVKGLRFSSVIRYFLSLLVRSPAFLLGGGEDAGLLNFHGLTKPLSLRNSFRGSSKVTIRQAKPFASRVLLAGGGKAKSDSPVWMNSTHVPFTRVLPCPNLSLSSTWGRADQHASHDSDESGAFCFALLDFCSEIVTRN